MMAPNEPRVQSMSKPRKKGLTPQVELHKCLTGIKGFDEITEGREVRFSSSNTQRLLPRMFVSGCHPNGRVICAAANQCELAEPADDDVLRYATPSRTAPFELQQWDRKPPSASPAPNP